MGESKKVTLSLGKILIFLLIAIFPFGQLLRMTFNVGGHRVVFIALDTIAGLVTFLYLWANRRKLSISNPHPLLLIAVFSLLVSFSFLDLASVFFGSLYLARVVSYVGLYIFLRKYKILQEDTVGVLLVLVSVFVALLGLLQYFYLPDLRTIGFLGWDGHWYRLVGSFIDPGFTGLLLGFGFIESIVNYSKTNKKLFLLASMLILVALALTYARAAYIALIVGVIVILRFVKKKILILAMVFVFLISLPLLPRPAGVGVQLERTHSVYSRFASYEETYKVWRKSPVFGVGFNNLCSIKRNVLVFENIGQNSCSGSDSSLFLILATTGIVGLITFAHESVGYLRKINFKKNVALFAIVAALAVHSLFLNSLFYPWVMAWLAIKLAVRKE